MEAPAAVGLGSRVVRHQAWHDPLLQIAMIAQYVALLGRWIVEYRGREGNEWDTAAGDLLALVKATRD